MEDMQDVRVRGFGVDEGCREEGMECEGADGEGGGAWVTFGLACVLCASERGYVYSCQLSRDLPDSEP